MCFALTLIKFVILFTDDILRRLVNRRKREIILIFLKKKKGMKGAGRWPVRTRERAWLVGLSGGQNRKLGILKEFVWFLTLVSYIYILHYIEDGFIHCNQVGPQQ